MDHLTGNILWKEIYETKDTEAKMRYLHVLIN